MLKILGSVLILTASVGGCLTFLERFREEERQLLAMKEMLIIFEKQLEYVRLPIARGSHRYGKESGSTIRRATDGVYGKNPVSPDRGSGEALERVF